MHQTKSRGHPLPMHLEGKLELFCELVNTQYFQTCKISFTFFDKWPCSIKKIHTCHMTMNINEWLDVLLISYVTSRAGNLRSWEAPSWEIGATRAISIQLLEKKITKRGGKKRNYYQTVLPPYENSAKDWILENPFYHFRKSFHQLLIPSTIQRLFNYNTRPELGAYFHIQAKSMHDMNLKQSYTLTWQVYGLAWRQENTAQNLKPATYKNLFISQPEIPVIGKYELKRWIGYLIYIRYMRYWIITSNFWKILYCFFSWDFLEHFDFKNVCNQVCST